MRGARVGAGFDDSVDMELRKAPAGSRRLAARPVAAMDVAPGILSGQGASSRSRSPLCIRGADRSVELKPTSPQNARRPFPTTARKRLTLSPATSTRSRRPTAGRSHAPARASVASQRDSAIRAPSEGRCCPEATRGARGALSSPAESFTLSNRQISSRNPRRLELVATSGVGTLSSGSSRGAPCSTIPEGRAACRPERDAGLRINQKRHFAGERPGGSQRGWVRIGHVFIQPSEVTM